MGSIHTPDVECIDRILKRRVDGERASLHNACFSVIDKEGTLYSVAYGSRDLAQTQPITSDSFFWIASLSKLSAAVATLIAVDKGLVTLDQNVRDVVPELADLDVLEGFDDEGVPRLRKCTAPISLRQLLSHSSGFCYDKQHEGLQRWAAYVGKKEGTFIGSLHGYLYPLIFEPGQGWAYGSGMDWAGRTVEIVAKQDLESFMQTNIWAPLGMGSTTFRPWTRPDLTEKLVELAWRNPDGTLAKGKVPFGYPAADCCAGVGLYSTPEDQGKLLSALLGGGAGIISKESMDELLRPQTADPSLFLSEVCGSKRGHLGQTWPEGSKGDFGLSSSINAENFPGRRAAGSANWQGMPGVHAWLDRTTGLAGLFMTQVLPPGDKLVTDCFCALEETSYRIYGSCSGESTESHA
ncbi:beta-lactamase family protein [Parachaetomium inaequale]|uniref:Beta-lactamase family protein n=1 Tax=Parachaetomium inaequale TaxID=2588326 RepID=A0AAN6P4D9_9PEZI|nr:beta-lactamase family protein [Parachaetomium inaequale]